MKFDGRGFAQKIEEQVKNKVRNFVGKPHVVSILVGDDPASHLYTKLKKQAAERVGIEFEVVKVSSCEGLTQIVEKVGENSQVQGMMIQLPIPSPHGETSLQGLALKEVLDAIPKEKDIDGLRYPESGIVPPVVAAILQVINEIEKTQSSDHSPKIAQGSELGQRKYVVVGASGFVGSAVCSELEKMRYQVIKVDSDTQNAKELVLQGDMVISCVGKEGVVRDDMVKKGAVVIDVGAPKGDMTKEVYQNASISVEVPGGIGPVTIACLMQSVVDRCRKI